MLSRSSRRLHPSQRSSSQPGGQGGSATGLRIRGQETAQMEAVRVRARLALLPCTQQTAAGGEATGVASSISKSWVLTASRPPPPPVTATARFAQALRAAAAPAPSPAPSPPAKRTVRRGRGDGGWAGKGGMLNCGGGGLQSQHSATPRKIVGRSRGAALRSVMQPGEIASHGAHISSDEQFDRGRGADIGSDVSPIEHRSRRSVRWGGGKSSLKPG